jgi:hypothetical protein
MPSLRLASNAELLHAREQGRATEGRDALRPPIIPLVSRRTLRMCAAMAMTGAMLSSMLLRELLYA